MKSCHLNKGGGKYTEKKPCLLVPRTGLLGGKQTLLTTVDNGGGPCRMSDGPQKTGEFRGREVGGAGGEGTMAFLFLEATSHCVAQVGWNWPFLCLRVLPDAHSWTHSHRHTHKCIYSKTYAHSETPDSPHSYTATQPHPQACCRSLESNVAAILQGFPSLGHFPLPSSAWEPACDLHSCGWDHASGIRMQLVQLPALESRVGSYAPERRQLSRGWGQCSAPGSVSHVSFTVLTGT